MAEANPPGDILANATVTGPNVLPLDASAGPAVPAAPEADEATGTDGPRGTPPEEVSPDGSSGTDEPDEEDAGDGSEPETARPRARKKSRQTMQERLSELSHQRNLAKQEADYWKQRALPGADGAPVPAQEPAGIPRTADGRPVRPEQTQFESYPVYEYALKMYEDALVDWRVSTVLTQERLRQQEDAALQRVKEQHTDYDDVVRDAKVTLPHDVANALIASQDKHALIYYLATHPEEATGLREVHGPAAYLAIGRLEAKLPSGAARSPGTPGAPGTPGESTPRVSQAPAPITPTNGVGVAATRSYDDMSLEEFFAARNKEEARRRH